MVDTTKERQRPVSDSPWTPKDVGPLDGPRSPAIDKPDTTNIIKRMRSIENDRARRYRQRSGE